MSIDQRTKGKIVTAVLVTGLVSFFAYDKFSEWRKERNLAPNSIWVGGNQFEEQYGKAFLKNKDLDGDGKYESVIRWVGPDGKYQELPIVLNAQGLPQVVYPQK